MVCGEKTRNSKSAHPLSEAADRRPRPIDGQERETGRAGILLSELATAMSIGAIKHADVPMLQAALNAGNRRMWFGATVSFPVKQTVRSETASSIDVGPV